MTQQKGIYNFSFTAAAQKDLEAMVGDQSAINSDGFSKIKGWFNIQIPPTCAKVDEVIERRLLAKEGAARQLLAKPKAETRCHIQQN